MAESMRSMALSILSCCSPEKLIAPMLAEMDVRADSARSRHSMDESILSATMWKLLRNLCAIFCSRDSFSLTEPPPVENVSAAHVRQLLAKLLESRYRHGLPS